jgi:2',3'-cyclic-nucleotide 2'-phosphodiesterase/3'-nucleotidase/5'-nucleotidase
MRKPLWFTVGLVFVVVMVLVGYTLCMSGRPAGEAPPVAGLLAAEPADQMEPARPGTSETIVLLHTNDFHGAVQPVARSDGSGESGGLVNLVSLIDQVRAENPGRTLLLDAGDTFQGTYLSNSTQGEVVMAAMNAAGYDAWALGNHEFDWGQEPLRARITQADFPALAANIIDASTGEVWDAVDHYTIVEVGQARVAILGSGLP